MPNESSEQPNGAYVEITTPKGSRILTGEPANYPTELAAAIKQYAQGDESINALWLQLKQTVKPEDTLPSDQSFLLTVDLNGKPDATFERIANAVKTYIPFGIPLDMRPYDSSQKLNVAPLYAKNMYIDRATAGVRNPALSDFIKLYYAINPNADTEEFANVLRANRTTFADPVLSSFVGQSNIDNIHEHPEITAKNVKRLILSRINQEIALNAHLITTVHMLNESDGRPVESYEIQRSDNGALLLLTFTDLGEFRKASNLPHGTNTRIISTTFDEFFKITSGEVAMIINFGNERIELSPELIKKMGATKETRNRKIQNKETARTIINDIPNPPSELFKLGEFIATSISEIRAIWAKLKYDIDVDYKNIKNSYLLIIEHDGEFSDITERLNSVLMQLTSGGLSIEAVSYLNDLGRRYIKGQPIYSDDRSKFVKLGRVVEEYKKMTAKDCYDIRCAEGEPSILDDKFGGQPYLPIGEHYPTDEDGAPLPLLFQINLENVDLPNWPKNGILEIFVDTAGGYPCKYAVKLFPSGQEYQTVFPEIDTSEQIATVGKKITIEKTTCYMSTSDFRFNDVIMKVFRKVYGHVFSHIQDITDFLEGSETWLDSLNDLTASNPCAMLGGYQDFAQNDPREEDAELATKTESLLKLESAEEYGMSEIGDAGVLFTFISTNDLRNGKFENAVVDYDSC